MPRVEGPAESNHKSPSPGGFRRPKTERLLGYGTEAGLHLLLFLSPIFFGSVFFWAYLPARGLILLLTGVTVVRLCLFRETRPLWTWLTPPAALFLGWVLFSLTSLSGDVLKSLSPKALAQYEDVVRWRREVEASVLAPLRELAARPAEAPSGVSIPSTLSVDPWRTRRSLLHFLTPLFVFFIAANLGGSRSQTKRFLVTLAGTAGLTSAYGLYQSFTGAQWVFWVLRWAGPRASGTFINANHFALYLEMALPLTAALLAALLLPEGPDGEQGWRSTLDRVRRGTGPWVVLVSLALALELLALIYTQSRLGIGSFLFSAIAGLAFLVRRKRVLASVSMTLALLGFLGLAALWVGIDQPMRRLLPADLEFLVKDGRARIWSDARELRGDFFWAGSGLGTFEAVYPRYQTIESALQFRNAHSDFLEVWTETGVIGFGLILLGIGGVLWQMIRLRRRREDPFARVFSGAALIGLWSVLLHSAGDFGLRMPANGYLFAFAAGLTVAVLKKPHSPTRTERRRWGRAARKGFRVACCGLVVVGLSALTWDTAARFRDSLRFQRAAGSRSHGRPGLEERRALLKEGASIRPEDERFLLALISAEEVRMRLDLSTGPEEGLRSALRVLELVGRGQLRHPASGDLIFAEGVILSQLDRWMMGRGGGTASASARGPDGEARGAAGEIGEGIRRLREPVAHLAWKALGRALGQAPTRFAFHYALALYGVLRWETLDDTTRRQTKASIVKAAGLSACPWPSPYQEKKRALEVMVRPLGDEALLKEVQRARCPTL